MKEVAKRMLKEGIDVEKIEKILQLYYKTKKACKNQSKCGINIVNVYK